MELELCQELAILVKSVPIEEESALDLVPMDLAFVAVVSTIFKSAKNPVMIYGKVLVFTVCLIF